MGESPKTVPEIDVKTIITKREEGLSSSQMGVTPPGNPNIQVIAMPWWQIVMVRTARVYGQCLLGFLTAAGLGATDAVGVHLPTGDFAKLLLSCAGLALAPATFTLIQNVVELLTRLDVTRPTFRA